MRHELFPAAELGPGEMRSVEVGGGRVLIARTPDGELHALRDRCSHMGARLSHGLVHRASEAAPGGGYRLSEEYVVSCPWHGFEFALSSGRCLADANHRARAYGVTIEDGIVVLHR